MLDERRLLFCRNIVAGMTKKDAAIEANFPARSAPSTATALLQEKPVRAEIERLRKERDALIGNVDDERKLKDHYASPLDLLRDVYNNPKLPFSVRYNAAKDALKYEVAPPALKGKKASKEDHAKETAAASKFAPGSRPKLRAVG